MTPRGGGATVAALALMTSGCVAPPARVSPPPARPATPAPAPMAARPLLPAAINVSGTPSQGALLTGQLTGGAAALTLDGRPVRVAADGRFLIGFGRDAPTTAMLRASFADGRVVERPITVAARQWSTEVIGTVPRRALPSAEFLKIREGELAQINAARQIDSASEGWRQAFAWPARGRISGLFGSQRIYKGGEKGDPHSGVDIAVPTGTPVLAPADGVVILAADHPFTLEGNLLMIDHGMGLNSAFLHLSRIDVRAGQIVRRGEPIGAVGMTGRAAGPHLHWALKWEDRRVDPLLVAGAMP